MTVATLSLLPGEQALTALNDEGIVLTDLRIRTLEKSWGYYRSSFMFLKDVSSIEVRYVQSLVVLILALVSLAIGLAPAIANNRPIFEGPTAVGFIGFILFLGMWWFSRKFVIRLTSAGGSTMDLEVAKISKVDANVFVDQIQAAMAGRGK